MKAFVTNRVGDWGFVVGLLLIFWGLGGSWLPGGFYQPDNLARLTVVAAESGEESGEHGAKAEHGKTDEHGKKETAHTTSAAKKAEGPAWLTMTAFPGATVYLDGSSVPFAVSPFVKREVKAGHHSLRVSAGLGVDDQEVPSASVEAGAESIVSLVGPVLAFRQLHDQLVMKDSRGQEVLKESLTSKTVWAASAWSRWHASAFSSVPPARARRSRSTSGYPMPWPVPRR